MPINAMPGPRKTGRGRRRPDKSFFSVNRVLAIPYSAAASETCVRVACACVHGRNRLNDRCTGTERPTNAGDEFSRTTEKYARRPVAAASFMSGSSMIRSRRVRPSSLAGQEDADVDLTWGQIRRRRLEASVQRKPPPGILARRQAGGSPSATGSLARWGSGPGGEDPSHCPGRNGNRHRLAAA